MPKMTLVYDEMKTQVRRKLLFFGQFLNANRHFSISTSVMRITEIRKKQQNVLEINKVVKLVGFVC